MIVEYTPNNSGGDWWLDDEDWVALERAGWKVEWASLEHVFTEKGNYEREVDGTPKLVDPYPKTPKFTRRQADGSLRYMGALAKGAWRVGLDLADAVSEWETVTGESSTDAGCPCCGQPHNFVEYNDDLEYVQSGPDIDYSCSW